MACAVLCVACYFFVDQPVAYWVAAHVLDHPARRLVFQAMAAPSLISLPFALGYLSVLTLNATARDADLPEQALLLRVSVAILAATAGKDALKWACGRPWPHSLLNYGLYHLHPFTDDPLYGSFPSGHTAYISAPLLVIAHLKPALKWPCYGIIAMVMIGLIGGGYHYPGDTIAGLFTGTAAAAGTLALMRGR